MDRSLALNPSYARGWYWSGVLRLFAGQPDLALKHFETFLRLSPRDRLAVYLIRISGNFWTRVSLSQAAVAGSSYGADAAGAQPTAQSERIKA